MGKIRAVLVDDSFFMRQTLTKILSSENIEVVDTARNGKEGIEKIKERKPDVVTMDIEMPVMNGLDALKELMETFPVPVIMVSTLTSEGAESTLDALSLGAVDFVTKKAAFKEMGSIKDELISKIVAVGENTTLQNELIRKRLLLKASRPKDKKAKTAKPPIDLAEKKTKEKLYRRKKRPQKDDISIIGIGISTGGPAALKTLIPQIPGNLPVPIVIAQHMPEYFTKTLADRINANSQLKVKEAEDAEKLKPGTVYIAPGGKQLEINRNFRTKIFDVSPEYVYSPSVEALIGSLVKSYGDRVLGVMMTGMGNDGLESFKKLNDAGGYIIVQDVDTCVVGGMPGAIINAGIADEIQSLNRMAHAISTCFSLTPLSN